MNINSAGDCTELMENRRKYHRLPCQQEPCTVFVDDAQFQGVLADESISGAKIINLDLLMMPYNKPLTIEHRDATLTVNARNVERAENRKFELGVVRSELLNAEQASEASAMLINCYVQHGNTSVICMPIQIESETQILIQLWDGVQFRVPQAKLKPLTRLERFEMLGNERSLAYTAAMYGFDDLGPEVGRQQVFEHEFGSYPDCPVTRALVASR